MYYCYYSSIRSYLPLHNVEMIAPHHTGRDVITCLPNLAGELNSIGRAATGWLHLFSRGVLPANESRLSHQFFFLFLAWLQLSVGLTHLVWPIYLVRFGSFQFNRQKIKYLHREIHMSWRVAGDWQFWQNVGLSHCLHVCVWIVFSKFIYFGYENINLLPVSKMHFNCNTYECNWYIRTHTHIKTYTYVLAFYL